VINLQNEILKGDVSASFQPKIAGEVVVASKNDYDPSGESR
jgi:hypothetical protein